jgi:PhnB protein
MNAASDQPYPAKTIRGVPTGYHAVTPWVISRDTAQLLDFVRRAFDAQELARIHGASGAIEHAEFRVADSVVMAFDAPREWPDTPAFLRLYVEDADDTHRRAVGAGPTSITEMTYLFFGERVGRVRDPQGNFWWIHERVEDLDPAEMQRRAGQPQYVEAMRYVQSAQFFARTSAVV